MERLGLEEGQCIENSMISNAIKNSQEMLLAVQYEDRKELFYLDSFLESQRSFTYTFHRKLLDLDTSILADLDSMAKNWATQVVTDHYPRKTAALSPQFIEQVSFFDAFDSEDLQDLAEQPRHIVAKTLYETLRDKLDEATLGLPLGLISHAMLSRLDEMWEKHLTDYNALKNEIFQGRVSPDAYSRFQIELDKRFWLNLANMEKDTIQTIFNYSEEFEKPERPAPAPQVSASEPKWRQLPEIKGTMIGLSPLRRLAGHAADPTRNLKILWVVATLLFGFLFVPGWWDVSLFQTLSSNPVFKLIDELLTGNALSRGAILLFGIIPIVVVAPKSLHQLEDVKVLRWCLAVPTAVAALEFFGITQWTKVPTQDLLIPLGIFLLPNLLLRQLRVTVRRARTALIAPFILLSIIALFPKLTGISIPASGPIGTFLIVLVLLLCMNTYKTFLLKTKQITLIEIVLTILVASSFFKTYVLSPDLAFVFLGLLCLFIGTGAWLIKTKIALTVLEYTDNGTRETVIEAPSPNGIIAMGLTILTILAGLGAFGLISIFTSTSLTPVSDSTKLMVWPVAGFTALGMLAILSKPIQNRLITSYISSPLVYNLFKRGYTIRGASSLQQAETALTELLIKQVRRLGLFIVAGLILHAVGSFSAILIAGDAAAFSFERTGLSPRCRLLHDYGIPHFERAFTRDGNRNGQPWTIPSFQGKGRLCLHGYGKRDS